MSKYEKLDAAILASIGSEPKLSHRILAGEVERECSRHRQEVGANTGRHKPLVRILDGRLQALRKAGKIQAQINRGWTLVEAAAVASSSKHVFTVKRVSDDQIDYALDGEHLVSANHDDHGWAGMEEIEKLVNAIAGKIGADVVESTD